MGCTVSKLGDEEAVSLCRDRKNFVKQAIKLRNRFASDHIAYIQSLRRVAAALIHYVEAHEHNDFFFNSNLTPPLASVDKRLNSRISGVPLKSLKSNQKKPMKSTAGLVNYLRSGGNPSVSVEQAPEPEETERIESYYPMDHHRGINYNCFTSLWDHLWNPFPSLDSYGYTSSFDRTIDNDDVDGLRQIREEEGIPELEDVDGEKNKENLRFWKGETENEKPKDESKHAGVDAGGESSVETNQDFEKVPEVENKSLGSESIEVSETQGTVDLEIPNQREVERTNGVEETPGYTVYVNRRPTSMAEAMKDIENQFMRIFNSAHEVSIMLEASITQNSPVSNELTGSLASRFWQASSSSKDDINSIYCMVPARHQATLNRLYEWEKKLYEEVKVGEQVRIEYEKKCKQLSHHDIYGEEPSAVDQTIAAIRVLHTNFKVYIHTVESISKRIEALRDAELCPQLMKLIQGLSRMWKTMADSHRIQKRTIEDAKLLLFTKASTNPSMPSHAAAILSTEVQNWRRCLCNWVNTNRSYAAALAGWASRCASPEAADAIGNRNALSALSPFRGGEMPPVFGMCRQWSRMLESISEKRAVEGMEFFAAGIASVSAQLREAERTGMPVPDLAAVTEMRKMVLCTGLSVAARSMAEFAGESVQGYGALLRRCRGDGRREIKGNVYGNGKAN